MSAGESTSTVWDALRERQREIAEERDPLYLEDPLHEGVVFRYRYVPLEANEKSLKRVKKVKGELRQLAALSIERILLCLDEILIASPGGEIPTGQGGRKLYDMPLAPLSDDDIPLRFDQRLCEKMGYPPETSQVAARIVRKWFGDNAYLIMDHAGEVSEWLTEVGNEVRDEFSEAAGKA